MMLASFQNRYSQGSIALQAFPLFQLSRKDTEKLRDSSWAPVAFTKCALLQGLVQAPSPLRAVMQLLHALSLVMNTLYFDAFMRSIFLPHIQRHIFVDYYEQKYLEWEGPLYCKVNTPLTKPKVIFLFFQSTVILNYLPTLAGGINNTLSLFMNRLKKPNTHMQILCSKKHYPMGYIQGLL